LYRFPSHKNPLTAGVIHIKVTSVMEVKVFGYLVDYVRFRSYESVAKVTYYFSQYVFWKWYY